MLSVNPVVEAEIEHRQIIEQVDLTSVFEEAAISLKGTDRPSQARPQNVALFAESFGRAAVNLDCLTDGLQAISMATDWISYQPSPGMVP